MKTQPKGYILLRILGTLLVLKKTSWNYFERSQKYMGQELFHSFFEKSIEIFYKKKKEIL